jgi:hypothetical protein
LGGSAKALNDQTVKKARVRYFIDQSFLSWSKVKMHHQVSLDSSNVILSEAKNL